MRRLANKSFVFGCALFRLRFTPHTSIGASSALTCPLHTSLSAFPGGSTAAQGSSASIVSFFKQRYGRQMSSNVKRRGNSKLAPAPARGPDTTHPRAGPTHVPKRLSQSLSIYPTTHPPIDNQDWSGHFDPNFGSYSDGSEDKACPDPPTEHNTINGYNNHSVDETNGYNVGAVDTCVEHHPALQGYGYLTNNLADLNLQDGSSLLVHDETGEYYILHHGYDDEPSQPAYFPSNSGTGDTPEPEVVSGPSAFQTTDGFGFHDNPQDEDQYTALECTVCGKPVDLDQFIQSQRCELLNGSRAGTPQMHVEIKLIERKQYLRTCYGK